jgi:hypothetical protein
LRDKKFSRDKGTLKRRIETLSTAPPAYLELVDFIAAGTTPETLLAFRPSVAVQGRVQELILKNRLTH